MKTIEDVRALCAEEKYDEAIGLLDDANFESSTTLVWKAIIAQLGDTKYSLEDAHNFLQRAVQLEPKNVEALFELAAFLQNVAEDEKAALPIYERAIQAHGERLSEVIAGALTSKEATGADTSDYLEQLARQLIDINAIKSQIG